MRTGLPILLLLAAGCQSQPAQTERQRIDDAYQRGEADAVKRLYWAKQALEAPRGPAGRVEYYSWEDAGAPPDGRRLSPERVSVPVFIPDPAPSGPPP
ncbi:MAG TPA: hypothetical protein VGG37_08575 [Opitutaceae bacterium]|jgi:hypothetical protein